MIEILPLTRREKYLKNGGGTCPACLSTNIECGTGTEMDGTKLYVSVSCNDCDATWDDEYDLAGVANADGFDPDEVAVPAL